MKPPTRFPQSAQQSFWKEIVNQHNYPQQKSEKFNSPVQVVEEWQQVESELEERLLLVTW